MMDEFGEICNNALKHQDASMNDPSIKKSTKKHFITSEDYYNFMDEIGHPLEIYLKTECKALDSDEEEEAREHNETKIEKKLMALIIEYIHTKSKK
jgi:hypothetical protein